MPLDINLFREDKGADLNVLRESQRRRFARVELIDEIVALDKAARELSHESMECNRQSNELNKKMKPLQIKKRQLTKEKKASEVAAVDKDIEELKAKLAALKEEQQTKKAASADKERERDEKLNLVGNLVHESVPVSQNEETGNRVEKLVGEPRRIAEPLHHHEILHMLDGVDQERAVKVAGHRAYFLRGVGVQLNQALIAYALDFLSKRDYTPVQTPFFMLKSVMGKTCQLGGGDDDRGFDDDMYRIPNENAKKDLVLIATSEQPLSAYYAGESLTPPELPIRFAGYSTNFRKESGSHGKETWGVYRVHQFEKIEQFLITAPEQSWEALASMLETAEAFYTSLGLAYRVVTIISKELNAATAKKYDLEAWFPGYDGYRELVSASNCTDYQSRALDIKYLSQKDADGRLPFVHMLNGTLCATERTMCCLLENYQRADGVDVPEVLRPYLGGKDFLPFVKERPAHVAGEAPAVKKKANKAKAKADKGAATK